VRLERSRLLLGSSLARRPFLSEELSACLLEVEFESNIGITPNYKDKMTAELDFIHNI
jgi:hypothetical protein